MGTRLNDDRFGTDDRNLNVSTVGVHQDLSPLRASDGLGDDRDIVGLEPSSGGFGGRGRCHHELGIARVFAEDWPTSQF